MSNKKSILKLYAVAFFLIFFGFAIITKLIIIQFIEGDKLVANISKQNIKFFKINPERGNIYSSNGLLLATSLPQYEIRFDPVTVDSILFYSEIDSLSKYLMDLYPKKSNIHWKKELIHARKKGFRYHLISKNLSYKEFQKIKNAPIFSEGKYKGGFIEIKKSSRAMPFGKMAERTIGQQGTNVGLEGAYNHYLSGEPGNQLRQKVIGNVWKSIDNAQSVLPIHGKDVVVTIDAVIQDFTHDALLHAVENYKADFGCAIVMEVNTGKIRAISNLSKTKIGTYAENFNHAIHTRTEVGSTFKLASLISALEDGCVELDNKVETGNGSFVFYDGKEMKDTKGNGNITIQKAFEISSNIGIAKVIDNCYKDQPRKFIDRLYNMTLNQSLNLDLIGERAPKIRKTSDKAWSKLSLPWMATGYEVEMTPMQILTFYNSIANNGEMLKPIFLEHVLLQGNHVINKKNKEVINTSVCSIETIKKAQSLLLGVVENGTTKNHKTNKYKFAGKTGTIRLNYWKEDEDKQYQASFVGYYPAEKPKYSCIVVVNNPDPLKGYYGSVVAAPVFRKIMDGIHSINPEILPLNDFKEDVFVVKKIDPMSFKKKSIVPDVIGLPAMDAIYLLENIGLEVTLIGKGIVKQQSIQPGKKIIGTQNIIIELV